SFPALHAPAGAHSLASEPTTGGYESWGKSPLVAGIGRYGSSPPPHFWPCSGGAPPWAEVAEVAGGGRSLGIGGATPRRSGRSTRVRCATVRTSSRRFPAPRGPPASSWSGRGRPPRWS